MVTALGSKGRKGMDRSGVEGQLKVVYGDSRCYQLTRHDATSRRFSLGNESARRLDIEQHGHENILRGMIIDWREYPAQLPRGNERRKDIGMVLAHNGDGWTLSMSLADVCSQAG